MVGCPGRGDRAVGPTQAGLNGRTVPNIGAKNAQIAAAVAARPSFCTLIDLSAYADDPEHPGKSRKINFASNPYQPLTGGDDLHPGLYGVSQKGAPAVAAFIRSRVESGNALIARRARSILDEASRFLWDSVPISRKSRAGGGTTIGFVAAHMTSARAPTTFRSYLFAGSQWRNGRSMPSLSNFPSGASTKEVWNIRPNQTKVITANLQDAWSRTWFEVEVDQWGGWLSAMVICSILTNISKLVNLESSRLVQACDGFICIRRTYVVGRNRRAAYPRSQFVVIRQCVPVRACSRSANQAEHSPVRP